MKRWKMPRKLNKQNEQIIDVALGDPFLPRTRAKCFDFCSQINDV